MKIKTIMKIKPIIKMKTTVEITLDITQATQLKEILDNLDDNDFMNTRITGKDRKAFIQLKEDIPYE